MRHGGSAALLLLVDPKLRVSRGFEAPRHPGRQAAHLVHRLDQDERTIDRVVNDVGTPTDHEHDPRRALHRGLRRYCWPVDGIADLKLAPFHLLASERAVHVDKPHSWHMDRIERLAAEDQQLLRATAHVTVDTTDPAAEAGRPRGGTR